MPQSVAQKLRITEGMTLRTLHAPDGFADALAPLPAGVKVSNHTKDYAQIHWFVRNKAQMEAGLDEVLGLLKDDVLCWIYYPKGSSGIQTDLTRDKGWEGLLSHKNIQWITLISFDDTWSAFSIRLQSSPSKPKPSKPAVNPVDEYADRAARTTRLPEDLEKAFRKAPDARAYFDSLAFSHRREYLEWIVTAKRPETRAARIAGTVERLGQGWKNPRNQ
ncbi:YdeI/OmpD-associated family protein [Dinghuibacter silviterrae]|uniref:Bacteriocin resistance YdeI/OmpD-like protein n=1 Tax=Dinghuibacter silviterrae TaxID=1539049 RepID=A0A4R8DWU8_9BACT|nr:YdeI/OmpD-associated family protein [Dinghuibacter silviterrae]TDX02005.1 bacteriocin resistance YdeI/OmpD-like protein [Dinghuibacter silviterrae]